MTALSEKNKREILKNTGKETPNIKIFIDAVKTVPFLK